MYSPLNGSLRAIEITWRPILVRILDALLYFILVALPAEYPTRGGVHSGDRRQSRIYSEGESRSCQRTEALASASPALIQTGKRLRVHPPSNLIFVMLHTFVSVCSFVSLFQLFSSQRLYYCVQSGALMNFGTWFVSLSVCL